MDDDNLAVGNGVLDEEKMCWQGTRHPLLQQNKFNAQNNGAWKNVNSSGGAEQQVRTYYL